MGKKGTGFLNVNRMPLKIHENILVFYRKLPTYNPQKTFKNPYIRREKSARTERNYGAMKGTDTIKRNSDGSRFPVDVLEFANVNLTQKRPIHPTQKPVPLLEWLIRTYTNEGETVLDNVMGSGSTGVSCVKTGRKFIGIEIEKEYFDIALERIEQAEEEGVQNRIKGF